MGDFSSSSDDEPMISSPDASGNENSDDDDIFHYQKRKFVKTAVGNGNNTPPASASARGKRSKQMPFDDQMTTLERNKEIKEKKLRGRINRKTSQHDSDDDSVVEFLDQSKATAKSGNNDDSSIEVLASPSDSSRYLAASNQPSLRASMPIDLLDSSDDESPRARISQMPLSRLKGASKELMDVLQRSKQATLQLRRAQHYHAEDIQVDTRELETPSIVSKAQQRFAPASNQRQPIDFGSALRFTCRIQLEINGKKKESTQKVYTLRENEQFQVLLAKFLKANAIPTGARINMIFDGMALDMIRTPSSYEMVDEDLIDVNGKVNVIPTSIQSNNHQNSFGPKLTIKLRRKLGKKVEEYPIQIGQRETFQRILDAYRERQKLSETRVTLRFDGECINLSKTPAAYGMESGDLIDVICD
jgi:hypothetical protein